MGLARKLTHISLAVVPLAGWVLGQWAALALAVLLLLGSLLLELTRRTWPWVDRTLWGHAPGLFRKSEEHGILGSTWYCAAMLAALLFFGQNIGGMATLFLALGDPAAELAGRHLGGASKRKTWAGSLACLLVCVVVATAGSILGRVPLAAALAGAVSAVVAERWPPPPSDNVWMPLFSALTMAAVRQVLAA
jgi:dolichol kinase